MTDANPSLSRRLLRMPVEIVVAIYLVLDSVVAPLFGPPMRWLSSLRVIQRLEALIAALPAYVILVLLVVPFGFAEIAKVYAVLLMAEDHVRTGATIFVGAYIVSILVCERTFHAGKGQLMTIAWFKRLYDWVTAMKERILAWLRRTQMWRAADAISQRARAAVRSVQAASAPAAKGRSSSVEVAATRYERKR